MSPVAKSSPERARSGRAAWFARALVATLLGLAAALLISCGSSGKGLIPTADAGPLQSDFEAVSQAALNGNGSCAATEAAIAKTVRDFNALPPALDAGLRARLLEGITNLSRRARELCAQPLTPVTTATTQKTATTPPTTATTTTPTTTSTTTTPTTTPTVPTTTTETGGGTAAPGETPSPGNGNGNGNGNGGEGRSGGVGAGEGK
jgi:hypothetical protein